MHVHSFHLSRCFHWKTLSLNPYEWSNELLLLPQSREISSLSTQFWRHHSFMFDACYTNDASSNFVVFAVCVTCNILLQIVLISTTKLCTCVQLSDIWIQNIQNETDLQVVPIEHAISISLWVAKEGYLQYHNLEIKVSCQSNKRHIFERQYTMPNYDFSVKSVQL